MMNHPYRSHVLCWASLLVLASLLLSSCVVAPTPYAPTPLPVPTSAATATIPATATLAPTATLAAAATEVATATATATTLAAPTFTITPGPVILPTAAPAQGALSSLGLGQVQALAISAKGDTAVASPFGVQIYRSSSFRPLWSLTVAGGVTALAYSPDGTRLVGAAPSALVLWDADNGLELARFEAANDALTLAGLTFAPDASRVYGQDMAGYVLSWDLSSSAPAVIAEGDPNRAGSGPHLAFLNQVAVSPDGKQILFSQWSKLSAWDLTKNVAAWTVDFTQSPNESVSAYGYTPDGASIYVAGIQGISYYNPQTGRSDLTLVSQPYETDLVYSADGKIMLSLANGRPLVWDAPAGKVTARLPYSSVQKMLFYNEQTLALLLWDGEIRLVNLADGQPVSQLQGYTCLLGLQYLQDGRVLAADALGLFQIWDIALGTSVPHQPLPSIAALAIAPDAVLAAEVGKTAGGHILTSELNAEGQSIFALRDMAKPEALFSWPAPSSLGASTAAFSADSQTLAVLADQLYLIDVNAAKLRTSLKLPENISYNRPLFGPDGKTLILATYGPDYLLYSAVTGKLIRTISLAGAISELALSPDGKLLAVGSDSDSSGRSSSVSLVETSSGKVKFSLTQADTVQNSPLFAPDGASLVTIDHGSGRVWLWDTQTGQPRGSFTVAATSLAFSPDGKQLAVADSTGRIQFFDPHAALK